MSNFICKEINPASKKREYAIYCDNAFGHYEYGVYFYGDDFIRNEKNMDKKKVITEQHRYNLMNHMDVFTGKKYYCETCNTAHLTGEKCPESRLIKRIAKFFKFK